MACLLRVGTVMTPARKIVDSATTMPDGEVGGLTLRVPSGERRTEPAPESREASTDVPSARPTSVPDTFDVDWLAAGLARGGGGIPSDLAVPIRIPGAPLDRLDLRAAFLLLHVDGRSSVEQIASCADLPLSVVGEVFLELVALGCVAFAGTVRVGNPPKSGTFDKVPDEVIALLDEGADDMS
jgi:hypothetical protein